MVYVGKGFCIHADTVVVRDGGFDAMWIAVVVAIVVAVGLVS